MSVAKFFEHIVNFPFKCSIGQVAPAYEFYTSQLILYLKASISYPDFLEACWEFVLVFYRLFLKTVVYLLVVFFCHDIVRSFSIYE